MTGLTLAQVVRAKYPGVYDDISDVDLEAKITTKYPGAYDDLPKSAGISTPKRTPPYTPPPEKSYIQATLERLSNAPAAIGGWAEKTFIDPVVRANASASQAFKEGDYPLAAVQTVKSVVPGLAPASDYIQSKLDALYGAAAGTAPVTDVLPGGQAARGMTDEFLQTIATKGRPEAYGNLTADSLVQAALAKAPDAVPPAIQALKNNAGTIKNAAGAGVGAYLLHKGLAEASPAMRTGIEAAAATAGLSFGKGAILRKIAEVMKGTTEKPPVAARPTGLPDITGEPTGLPNKPITGVMPPEPPPAPAAEVPAASLADLVQQATRKPGTGIKFTTTAAEDAITELFNNNVKRKDAQTLLEDKFPDAHPETLKKIITEKYKEMIDKQRGKSTPEKPAPAEPPPAEPTTGRAWQEKNLKNVTDPVERERLIDEQSMKSTPPAIKALRDRNIGGKEFKDLFWQIATEKPESAVVKALGTEVTPSKTGIDKPPLAKLSGRTADDIPATLEGNRMADYATFVNETVANYANQVKIRAIDQETAIKKIQKETGATPSYAFYLFNKALKAQ